MHTRVIILLNINNVYYKFLSIFFSKKDPSYYLYNHIVDESGPLVIAEPFHLLSTAGSFSVDTLKKESTQDGHLIHLSVHPKRLYLKKRASDGKEEHLMAEMEPQPFNKDGFRLHCIFTPAPITHLLAYDPTRKRRKEELMTFEWSSNQCPQISIYEFENENIDAVRMLPADGLAIKVIDSDDLHPQIALHLKTTNGNPGIWRPNCGIFGKIVKKDPISKSELQRIIYYNRSKFDISSIPDDAAISDYKVIK